MPINNFGIGSYGNPLLANEDIQHDMFGGFNHEWDMDNFSSTMSPSTSGIGDPVSVIGKPTPSVAQMTQANESESNINIVDEESLQQTWYSEFEEMKNAERTKVNLFYI